MKSSTLGTRKRVLLVYIYGLKNKDGNLSEKGKNPFDCISYGNNGKKLSEIVKCYNPSGTNSKARYEWIEEHLSNVVEEAIEIRG